MPHPLNRFVATSLHLNDLGEIVYGAQTLGDFVLGLFGVFQGRLHIGLQREKLLKANQLNRLGDARIRDNLQRTPSGLSFLCQLH